MTLPCQLIACHPAATSGLDPCCSIRLLIIAVYLTVTKKSFTIAAILKVFAGW